MKLVISFLFLIMPDVLFSQKIYSVPYDYQAELKIFFVTHDYQAGWKNKEKMYLLY